MKTSKNSSYTRTIVPISTEKKLPSIRHAFFDECLFSKTDIGKYEFIFIIRPKALSLVGSSDLVLGQNHSNELFSIMRHYLAQEDFVKKILFLKENNVFNIWTAISGYNIESNRKSIYKNEIALMNFLSKIEFHFNFYLIEIEEVNEVLSSGAVVIYSKI